MSEPLAKQFKSVADSVLECQQAVSPSQVTEVVKRGERR